MITLEKAKKILKNNGEDFSDEETEKILNELKKHAEMILNDFKKKSIKTQNNNGKA